VGVLDARKVGQSKEWKNLGESHVTLTKPVPNWVQKKLGAAVEKERLQADHS